MQGTILTFGIIASIFVIVLKPKHAFLVYLGVVIWFPEFLRISVGTIDISCSRIVATVLLLRCISDQTMLRKFRWKPMDKAVALSMLVYVGISLLVQPTWPTIENRSGFVMDTWFAYLIARFIITDKKTLISIIKGVTLLLIPLAFLGLVEAATGWQPFVPLRRFRPWDPDLEITNVGSRWGFTRATGPFGHPILFGGVFAMFMPLIYTLRHEKKIWKTFAFGISGIMIAGALSSISSGPWVMIIVVLFCLFMERYKVWVKQLIYFFVFSIIFIQVFSNRPFYHVIFSYAGRLGGAGYHRIALIDSAIRDFGKWWFAGYGGKDPGWGYSLGMSFTDVTNEYILAGVRYGFIGVIVLCLVLFISFKSLRAAYKKDKDPYMKSIYWSLGSLLVSVSVVWMSVSFFGQLLTIFYICLGIIGSAVLIPDSYKQIQKKKTIDKAYKEKVLNKAGVSS